MIKTDLHRQWYFHWRLVLLLWLASLLTVLPLALLPGSALLSLAERPAIATLSDGLDAWHWLDLLAVIQSTAGTGQPLPAALRQALTGFGLAGALLLPLGGLVTAFCYGGLLFSLKPPAAAADILPAADIQPAAAGIQPAAAGIQAAADNLPGISELAGDFQPVTISGGTDLPAPGLAAGSAGAAARRFVQGGWRWLGLYALNLLVLLALQLLFRLAILPAAAVWWPAALLAQQIFIIARLWVRVARLASSLALARQGI
jgi:hypothetical protein